MIRVEQLEIHEFRGIRNLTLNLRRKNFAVCGPNGTGKSGIVDALEFALTGNISRLSGKGTGNLTLKEHAPHVDSRNNPGKARVKLVAWVPRLNRSISIERNAQSPAIRKRSRSWTRLCSPAVTLLIEGAAGFPFQGGCFWFQGGDSEEAKVRGR
jgi:DNA repair exonuclease SbcCD ATPase subunit